MADFTITQNVQVIKEFDSTTTEGYTRSDGAWVSSGTQVYAGVITTVAFRGYIEWDVSALKHVQSIQSVWLISDFYSAYQESSIRGIRAGQPSVAPDGATLYAWTGAGTAYRTESWTTNSDTRFWTIDLGSQAATDLYNDISGSTDFFSLGTTVTTETPGAANVLVLWGRNWDYSEPKNHILYVKYTSNNVVTITQPKDLNRLNSRSIDEHLFKSGNFAKHDIGGRGRVIEMVGSEWGTASATSLSNIDDMAELGKAVTLSGFADATLNDTWLIADFNWSKKGGHDTVHYDWNMILFKPSG